LARDRHRRIVAVDAAGRQHMAPDQLYHQGERRRAGAVADALKASAPG